MKRKIISWRIAIVILFIFGMGFFTGKLTEISRLKKIQGYKINLGTIESDALINTETSTPSDIETSTSSDVETSTSSDVETSTSSDVETSTSSDVETSTSSDVETSTPSDIETSTSSDVETSTPSDSNEKNEEKEEQDKKELSYNAENITENEIEEIKKSADTAKIIIDANNNSNVGKEIFDSIKGSNRSLVVMFKGDEWHFKGTQIKATKDIDVSIEKKVLTAEDEINVNKIISKGIIIKFNDNGDLPGMATIKLILTEEMKNIAVENKFNLYYYNESNKELELVQKEVSIINNEYVILKIDHNSEYILASKEDVNEQVPVVDKVIEEDVVSFIDNNVTYLIVIAASVLLIIIVVGMLIISGKKNKTINVDDKENSDK